MVFWFSSSGRWPTLGLFRVKLGGFTRTKFRPSGLLTFGEDRSSLRWHTRVLFHVKRGCTSVCALVLASPSPQEHEVIAVTPLTLCNRVSAE